MATPFLDGLMAALRDARQQITPAAAPQDRASQRRGFLPQPDPSQQPAPVATPPAQQQPPQATATPAATPPAQQPPPAATPPTAGNNPVWWAQQQFAQAVAQQQAMGLTPTGPMGPPVPTGSVQQAPPPQLAPTSLVRVRDGQTGQEQVMPYQVYQALPPGRYTITAQNVAPDPAQAQAMTVGPAAAPIPDTTDYSAYADYAKPNRGIDPNPPPPLPQIGGAMADRPAADTGTGATPPPVFTADTPGTSRSGDGTPYVTEITPQLLAGLPKDVREANATLVTTTEALQAKQTAGTITPAEQKTLEADQNRLIQVLNAEQKNRDALYRERLVATGNPVIDAIAAPLSVLDKPRQEVVTVWGGALYRQATGQETLTDKLLLADMPGMDGDPLGFSTWAKANPDDVKTAYEQGYNGFTGGRAVWERFQATRNIVDRAGADIITDPLNLLPLVAKGGSLLAKAGQGARLAEDAGVAQKVIGGTAEVIGRGGELVNAAVNAPADAVFGAGGKLVKGANIRAAELLGKPTTFTPNTAVGADILQTPLGVENKGLIHRGIRGQSRQAADDVLRAEGIQSTAEQATPADAPLLGPAQPTAAAPPPAPARLIETNPKTGEWRITEPPVVANPADSTPGKPVQVPHMPYNSGTSDTVLDRPRLFVRNVTDSSGTRVAESTVQTAPDGSLVFDAPASPQPQEIVVQTTDGQAKAVRTIDPSPEPTPVVLGPDEVRPNPTHTAPDYQATTPNAIPKEEKRYHKIVSQYGQQYPQQTNDFITRVNAADDALQAAAAGGRPGPLDSARFNAAVEQAFHDAYAGTGATLPDYAFRNGTIFDPATATPRGAIEHAVFSPDEATATAARHWLRVHGQSNLADEAKQLRAERLGGTPAPAQTAMEGVTAGEAPTPTAPAQAAQQPAAPTAPSATATPSAAAAATSLPATPSSPMPGRGEHADIITAPREGPDGRTRFVYIGRTAEDTPVRLVQRVNPDGTVENALQYARPQFYRDPATGQWFAQQEWLSTDRAGLRAVLTGQSPDYMQAARGLLDNVDRLRAAERARTGVPVPSLSPAQDLQRQADELAEISYVSHPNATEANALRRTRQAALTAPSATATAPEGVLDVRNLDPQQVRTTVGMSEAQLRKLGLAKYQMRSTDYAEESVQDILNNFNINRYEPISVRQGTDGNFYVTSGHSRLEAWRRAKRPQITVIVQHGSDESVREAAKLSNTAGTKLRPFDLAQTVRDLREGGLSYEQIAERMKEGDVARGKKGAGKVRQYDMLNFLPETSSIRRAVDDGALEVNKAATMGEAIGRGIITPAEADDTLAKLIGNDLTMTDVKRAIAKHAQIVGERGSSQMKLIADSEAGGTGFAQTVADLKALASERNTLIADRQSINRRARVAGTGLTAEDRAALTRIKDRIAAIDAEFADLEQTRFVQPDQPLPDTMDLGPAGRPVMQSGGATPGEALGANDLLQPAELTPEQLRQQQVDAGQQGLFAVHPAVRPFVAPTADEAAANAMKVQLAGQDLPDLAGRQAIVSPEDRAVLARTFQNHDRYVGQTHGQVWTGLRQEATREMRDAAALRNLRAQGVPLSKAQQAFLDKMDAKYGALGDLTVQQADLNGRTHWVPNPEYPLTSYVHNAFQQAMQQELGYQAPGKALRFYDQKVIGTFTKLRLMAPWNFLHYATGNLIGDTGQMVLAGKRAAAFDQFKELPGTWKMAFDPGYTIIDSPLGATVRAMGRPQNPGLFHANVTEAQVGEDALRRARRIRGRTSDNAISKAARGYTKAMANVNNASEWSRRAALGNFEYQVQYAARKGDLIEKAQVMAAHPGGRGWDGMDAADIKAVLDGLPPVFSPEDVRQALEKYGALKGLPAKKVAGYAEQVGRSWATIQHEIDDTVLKEVNRVVFDYSYTNADEILRRFVPFHFWATRALPFYVEQGMRHPGMLAAYFRMADGLQRANEQSNAPPYLKMAMGIWNTPAGYALFWNPLAAVGAISLMTDIGGTDPAGQTWFGKLLAETRDTTGLTLFPWFTSVLNTFGLMGDTTLGLDPFGTSKDRKLFGSILQYLGEQGWLGPNADKLLGKPFDQFLIDARARVSGAVGNPIAATDATASPRNQLATLIMEAIRQRDGLATGTPLSIDQLQEVNTALADQQSPLYQQALHSYATEGLRLNSLNLAVPGYLQRTLPAQNTQHDFDTNRAGIAPPVAGDYRALWRPTDPYADGTITPDERAWLDQWKAATGKEYQPGDLLDYQDRARLTQEIATHTPAHNKLALAMAEQRHLGTETQQGIYRTWNGLAFGTPVGPVDVLGHRWTPDEVQALPPDQRLQLADQWTAADPARYADYQTVRDLRAAYQLAHPELQAYRDWTKQVGAYASPAQYRFEVSRTNPNAARYFQQERQRILAKDPTLPPSAVEAKLDEITSTQRAYEAVNGIPADKTKPLGTGPAGVGAPGPGTAPGGSDVAKLQADVAAYQQKLQQANAYLSQVYGFPVDVAQLPDGIVRQTALAQLPPGYFNGTSQARAYLQWAQTQQYLGQPSDQATYLAQQQGQALLPGQLQPPGAALTPPA